MTIKDYKAAALALKEHNAWAMGGWDKWLHWALASAYERGVEEFVAPPARYYLDHPIQLQFGKPMNIHIQGTLVANTDPRPTVQEQRIWPESKLDVFNFEWLP